jgi:THUMP domain-like
MQLLAAIVKITMANITFAFLMIHNSFCKINEFRAKFVVNNNLILTNSGQFPTNTFKLQQQYGEFWPIYSEHISCLKKARTKLPHCFDANCIFPKVPFEQSTHEWVAHFHSTLIKGGHILSITGGLGIDDFAFATAGNTVTSLDPDACLNAVVEDNARCMNIQLERKTDTAEEYLAKNVGPWDAIYADPDRRPDGSRKGGAPDTWSPDIFNLIQQYPNASKFWWIKLSPMTDISWLLNSNLPPMDIWVVESMGEVREILACVHEGAQKRIQFVLCKENTSVSWSDEVIPTTESEQTLFFEPSPGVIKAGLHRRISSVFGLTACNRNETFFTGNTVLPSHLGRQFQLIDTLRGSLQSIYKDLGTRGIKKANILARQCAADTEEIRKKSGMADGGDIYLFFTGEKEKTCFVCEK